MAVHESSRKRDAPRRVGNRQPDPLLTEIDAKNGSTIRHWKIEPSKLDEKNAKGCDVYVTEQQIDPKKYYPKGYHPELLEDWPVEGDLVIPIEALPESLRESMGAEWRLRQKNQKILEEQSKQ